MRGLLAGLGLAVAVVLAPGASAAKGEQELFDRSWASSRWASIAVFMEAPRRLAAVVDRESIRTGPTANQREFNFLTISEASPAGTGIVGRLRIDCQTMALEDLGKVEYRDRIGAFTPPKAAKPVTLGTDAAIYPAVRGACFGDWGKMMLIDGDERAMRLKVFPS